MMACKAKLFKDEDAYKAIMLSKDPAFQKKMGRRVKNFNQDQWMEVAFDVVTLGNVLKFSQDADLSDWLFSKYAEYNHFVEASSYDTIWGIGLSEQQAKNVSESQWKGQNLLGKAIDKAYSIIKNNDLKEMERLCNIVSIILI